MIASNKVDASPTKRFFVSMLTRDIELRDAIMDLIDNCVDGILRTLALRNEAEMTSGKPYSGFWCRIVANPDTFSITDNCGGIPRKIAQESAFRLGRKENDQEEDIPTVGMYGIGMKRALFKMGRQSRVYSRHVEDSQEQSYVVEIQPEWLTNDDWNLEIQDVPSEIDEPGTKIEVSNLRPETARRFDPNAENLLEDLLADVKSFYALILLKGFRIYLNGDEIEPINLEILIPNDFSRESVPPYAYRGTYNEVDIELFVGFYRSLASEREIDDEQQIASSKDNAGWTVICNDRVVLHHDKSFITGWGRDDVPKYHNQFIAIAGVVRFSSKHPLNLPLNTTKRGLDTSAQVYWHTLHFMQEGLKMFTSFTNQWKGREAETTPQFRDAALVTATEVVSRIPADKWTPVRGYVGERFAPRLPLPPDREAKRRISFYRPDEEVNALSEYFFKEPGASPSDVGNKAFDLSLENAKKGIQP